VAAAQAGKSAPELNPAARAPRPAPRNNDIFAAEPPGPCPLTGSTVEVAISSVSFRGSTAVRDAAFRPAYAEFLGKPLPVSTICTIRDRAARILFDTGVLARVEIPEQRISDGALVLDVVEAHVVNVRVRGDIGPAQAAVEKFVEKLRGMTPFDMRKAQRYLLLASDVPGVRVRAAIKPSVNPDRGAVDIDVTVTRDGVDVLANVQNMGSKVVGRWGGLARADFLSFSPYGESTSLVAFHTLDSNEQAVIQVVESARIGGDGLVARAAAVYGVGHPGDTLKPLGIKSESVVGNLELSYPVIRMRRENLNVAGGFDVVDQKTTVIGTHDRLQVVYVRADGDLRTEVLGLPVQMNGALSLRKGLSANTANQSRVGAAPDAWVVKASADFETLLTRDITGAVKVQAQYADEALAPYEQMSLGNLSVGRGYDPAVLLGDKGAAALFELHYAPFQLHPKVQASPYVFFDVGHVSNNASVTGDGRTLRSVGAGAVFRIAGRANLEVTYAYPLDEVVRGISKPSPRLLLNLTASLL
jgi:hemolysin activation/secretion protein